MKRLSLMQIESFLEEYFPFDLLNIEPTEEFVEELYTFSQPYKTDEALFDIIQEEAAAYFTGQKSAQDVASIIQSRAQLYVNENR